MNFQKLIVASLFATAAIPATAYAQAEAPAMEAAATVAVTTGATIYGPDGVAVGTAEQVTDSVVVINTGTHSATLARDAFAAGDNGPVIGYTKAQLDEAVAAAVAQTEAKFEAALVPGAEIKTVDGVSVGTVESIGEDGNVLIAREAGTIALSRDQLGLDGETLIVRTTAADLEAALSQQAGG